MSKGIVITTSEHTKDWLPECLDSLKMTPYSVLVVSNGGYIPDVSNWNVKLIVNDWNGFELGGIQRGCEHFENFIHLMDSCVITEPEMLDAMFTHDGGVYLCDGFFSYLGKYRAEVCEKIGIPKIDNKADAITMEREWNNKYIKADTKAMRFPAPLPIHTDVFVEKHGRKNMMLDNGFIIKYKATWSI